jgi:uncharacterized membrane protein YhaH (DUF805 family)
MMVLCAPSPKGPLSRGGEPRGRSDRTEHWIMCGVNVLICYYMFSAPTSAVKLIYFKTRLQWRFVC